MVNIVEYLEYAQSRFLRTWRFYKQKAENIIHILFDDVFNGVVVLRLLGIVFSLAPIARKLVCLFGLHGMVQRHSEWFTEATGFTEVDTGRYLSDRLAYFGFSEASVVAKFLARQGKGQVADHFEWSSVSLVIFCQWRLFLPVVFYLLERWWVKLIDDQTADFKGKWKGHDYRDGAYADQLRKFGSLWNEVREAITERISSWQQQHQHNE